LVVLPMLKRTTLPACRMGVAGGSNDTLTLARTDDA